MRRRAVVHDGVVCDGVVEHLLGRGEVARVRAVGPLVVRRQWGVYAYDGEGDAPRPPRNELTHAKAVLGRAARILGAGARRRACRRRGDRGGLHEAAAVALWLGSRRRAEAAQRGEAVVGQVAHDLALAADDDLVVARLDKEARAQRQRDVLVHHLVEHDQRGLVRGGGLHRPDPMEPEDIVLRTVGAEPLPGIEQRVDGLRRPRPGANARELLPLGKP